MTQNLTIFDTTLRDGEQAPGAAMGVADKERLAAALDELGVDAIEAGFPVASPAEFEAVQAVSRIVRRANVVALCRARREDIDAAWDAICAAHRPVLHVFLPVSDLRIRVNLRTSRTGALELLRHAVATCKRCCPDVEFTAVDATRADPSFLREAVLLAVDAGATVANVPDSVGHAIPDEYAGLIGGLVSELAGSGTLVSAHCHDDLGLAVANTLAAVSAGARQVECCVNGLGERAGNAALEEVVMALKVRRDRYPFDVGIQTAGLAEVSELVSRTLDFPVPPNKAVVGKNAFSVQAGVHQQGLLQAPAAYELLVPEDYGFKGRRVVLGKHSGRNGLRFRLSELGYDLTDGELALVFPQFKTLADGKTEVTDDDLHLLVQHRHFESGALNRSRVESGGRNETVETARRHRNRLALWE